MLAMTSMIDSDHSSGNRRKKIYRPEERGGQEKDFALGRSDHKRAAYGNSANTGASVYIPARSIRDIWKSQEAYLGHISRKRRSGVSSANTNSERIYVANQRFYAHYTGWTDSTGAQSLNDRRANNARLKFESPKYAVRRAAQMRRDCHIKNRLAGDNLNEAPGESIYTETNWGNNPNAVGCTCYILAKHGRGADHIWEKWQPFQNEQTVCFKRHMAHEAMSPAHFERLMGDVEEFEGEDRPFMKECQTELEKLDNAWGI